MAPAAVRTAPARQCTTRQVEIHVARCRRTCVARERSSGHLSGVRSNRSFDYDRRCWKYWVSNLKGKSNGYCYLEHIYGRLFQVIH